MTYDLEAAFSDQRKINYITVILSLTRPIVDFV